LSLATRIDMPNDRAESQPSRRWLPSAPSSRLLAGVAAATMILVACELCTLLMLNQTETWAIRGVRILLEMCLAGLVSFVLLTKENHVPPERIGGVSGRMSAEEQMRLQSAALEAAANAIVITDAKGTILWVNRAFTDLTGYGPEESIGKNPRLLKSWDYDQSFYKNLWSTIQSGKVWHGEIRNRKKDGSLYTEEMTITPLYSPCGEITHFIAIKQDITEKKKLEAQYRHAQKMEAVGQLAGGVAHDFNNVLSIITGYSELSLDKLRAGDPIASNLHKIKAAAARAASLTKQLLAFSRQQIAFPKIVNLGEVVNDVADMLRRLVGDDVSITFRATMPLGAIRADVGQIEQILMNLIVNARDAMPNGGEIIIETRNVNLDETYQRTHEPVRPGPYVMLSVSDSGCGMDEETKTQIFEPFFTTKAIGKGTGLGLSTVYGIVKQSEGYIWVYSEPGRGTTLKLFFPRIGEIAEKSTRPVENVGPWKGSETILLVEDDEILRDLIVTTLENVGYRVLEAGTAEGAIELAAKHKDEIQLLLSDVVMAKVSGPQLSTLLRESCPKLKVVFMSGYAAEMLFRRDFLPRNASFMEKPFSRESLLSALHKALH